MTELLIERKDSEGEPPSGQRRDARPLARAVTLLPGVI